MRDQDKILINAYLDGEVTADETKLVEQLIKSSEEAQTYMESLKQINLELMAFNENKELKILINGLPNMPSKIKKQPTVIARAKLFLKALYLGT